VLAGSTGGSGPSLGDNFWLVKIDSSGVFYRAKPMDVKTWMLGIQSFKIPMALLWWQVCCGIESHLQIVLLWVLV
jgi:hypothetical protein